MSRYISRTNACVVVSLEKSHQSISYGAGDRTQTIHSILNLKQIWKQLADTEKTAHGEGLEPMRESIK